MSTEEPRPTTEERGRQPTEDELRSAYEAEVKKIRVEQVLLEHVVSLVNLGMRRTGLSPGTEDERDLEQVRLAIETIRALTPLVERSSPQHVGPIRDALSQLQLAFVRIGGSAGGAGEASGTGQPSGEPRTAASPREPQTAPGSQSPKADEPGPAQRSGKLWIPGQ